MKITSPYARDCHVQPSFNLQNGYFARRSAAMPPRRSAAAAELPPLTATDGCYATPPLPRRQRRLISHEKAADRLPFRRR